MQLLGYDLGSSSIKACLFDVHSGSVISSAASPHDELTIQSPKTGWAEQDPQVWWKHVKKVTARILKADGAKTENIGGIGIAYQMHGLVMVDENHELLHPAIIWCDGRAVDIGKKAFRDLGAEFCLEHYLNAPGNFTASKLRWIRENEPEIFARIYKVMLPGDYLAMRLTGTIRTSVSGLSEGIFWDYQKGGLATDLMAYYGIPTDYLPEYSESFSVSGRLTNEAAGELGLKEGTPVGYRAGDQPNNALSLNVLEPGEVAAMAGTSGVIYGITDKPLYDKRSRVNTFVHVNNEIGKERYGVLLCINGTGIQYSWIKNALFQNRYSYGEMNALAGDVPIGSEGVIVLPFGNGPERVLENRDPGALFRNLQFNRHTDVHLMRATQEGIVFSLNYGLQVMRGMGIEIETIRVGRDNMFQSPVFREAFTNTTGIRVEVFDSNGALGAAIGAGIGVGTFASRDEAFENLQRLAVLEPDPKKQAQYAEAYNAWENELKKELQS